MNWIERILFGLGIYNLVFGAINVVVDEGKAWLAFVSLIVGLMCLYFAEGDDNG